MFSSSCVGDDVPSGSFGSEEEGPAGVAEIKHLLIYYYLNPLWFCPLMSESRTNADMKEVFPPGQTKPGSCFTSLMSQNHERMEQFSQPGVLIFY